tara:strand:+ start:165 stop:569 length:405 start_codon:yes stop_codon:yes gene_type:complete
MTKVGDGGAGKVADKLKDFKGDFDKAVAAALYAEGTRVIALAIRKTPKRTGNLRDSNYIKGMHTGDNRRKRSVLVGFGGIAAPYALAVHEMGVNGEKIAWTTPGTGNRYLMNAVKEREPKMPEAIANDIEKYLD